MIAQEVKDILGITTIKHDIYINTVIPLFIEFTQDHCNNSFTDENEILSLKGGVKIAIAKMIEFNMNKAGQKSRNFGEVAYSYETDFPVSILRLLEPYRRIRV